MNKEMTTLETSETLSIALHQYGFPLEKCREALKTCSNDVESAATALIESCGLPKGMSSPGKIFNTQSFEGHSPRPRPSDDQNNTFITNKSEASFTNELSGRIAFAVNSLAQNQDDLAKERGHVVRELCILRRENRASVWDKAVRLIDQDSLSRCLDTLSDISLAGVDSLKSSKAFEKIDLDLCLESCDALCRIVCSVYCESPRILTEQIVHTLCEVSMFSLRVAKQLLEHKISKIFHGGEIVDFSAQVAIADRISELMQSMHKLGCLARLPLDRMAALCDVALDNALTTLSGTARPTQATIIVQTACVDFICTLFSTMPSLRNDLIRCLLLKIPVIASNVSAVSKNSGYAISPLCYKDVDCGPQVRSIRYISAIVLHILHCKELVNFPNADTQTKPAMCFIKMVCKHAFENRDAGAGTLLKLIMEDLTELHGNPGLPQISSFMKDISSMFLASLLKLERESAKGNDIKRWGATLMQCVGLVLASIAKMRSQHSNTTLVIELLPSDFKMIHHESSVSFLRTDDEQLFLQFYESDSAGTYIIECANWKTLLSVTQVSRSDIADALRNTKYASWGFCGGSCQFVANDPNVESMSWLTTHSIASQLIRGLSGAVMGENTKFLDNTTINVSRVSNDESISRRVERDAESIVGRKLFYESFCLNTHMEAFEKIAMNFISFTNSKHSLWRKTVIGRLSCCATGPGSLVQHQVVQDALFNALSDDSISVRSAAIELVGRLMTSHVTHDEEYIRHIRTMLNDSGISVRKQAVKLSSEILKRYVSTDVKQSAAIMCLDRAHAAQLMHDLGIVLLRPKEEESIKELIASTLATVWFDMSQCIRTSRLRQSELPVQHLINRVQDLVTLTTLLLNHSPSSVYGTKQESTVKELIRKVIKATVSDSKRHSHHDVIRILSEVDTGVRSNLGENTAVQQGYGKLGEWPTEIIIMGLFQTISTTMGIEFEKVAHTEIETTSDHFYLSILFQAFCHALPESSTHFLFSMAHLMRLIAQSNTNGHFDSRCVPAICNSIETAASAVITLDQSLWESIAENITMMLSHPTTDFSIVDSAISCLARISTNAHVISQKFAAKLHSLIVPQFDALRLLLDRLYSAFLDTSASGEVREMSPPDARRANVYGWLAWLHTEEEVQRNSKLPGSSTMVRDCLYALHTVGQLTKHVHEFRLVTGSNSDEISLVNEVCNIYFTWMTMLAVCEAPKPTLDAAKITISRTAMVLICSCLRGLASICSSHPQILLDEKAIRIQQWALRHPHIPIRAQHVHNLLSLLDGFRNQTDEGIAVQHKLAELSAGHAPSTDLASIREKLHESVLGVAENHAGFLTTLTHAQLPDLRRQFFCFQNYPSGRTSMVRLWMSLLFHGIVDPEEVFLPLLTMLGDHSNNVRSVAWQSIASVCERYKASLDRLSIKAIGASYVYQCRVFEAPQACVQQYSETESEHSKPPSGSSEVNCFASYYLIHICGTNGDRIRSRERDAFLTALVRKFRAYAHMPLDSETANWEDETNDDYSESEARMFDDPLAETVQLPPGLDTRIGPTCGPLDPSCSPFEEAVRAVSVTPIVRDEQFSWQSFWTGKKMQISYERSLIERADGVLFHAQRFGYVVDADFLMFLARVLLTLPYSTMAEISVIIRHCTSLQSLQEEAAREIITTDATKFGLKFNSETSGYSIANDSRFEQQSIQFRAILLQLYSSLLLKQLCMELSSAYSVKKDDISSLDFRSGERAVLRTTYSFTTVKFLKAPRCLRRIQSWSILESMSSSQNMKKVFEETFTTELPEAASMLLAKSKADTFESFIPTSPKRNRKATPKGFQESKQRKKV